MMLNFLQNIQTNSNLSFCARAPKKVQSVISNSANAVPTHRIPIYKKGLIQEVMELPIGNESINIGDRFIPKEYCISEEENNFSKMMTKLYTMNANIHDQSRDLYDVFYSTQGKSDIKELRSERRRYINVIKKAAKKIWDGSYEYLSEFILAKRAYNRYVPKILKCDNLKDLAELEYCANVRVSEKALKEDLLALIECKRKELLVK